MQLQHLHEPVDLDDLFDGDLDDTVDIVVHGHLLDLVDVDRLLGCHGNVFCVGVVGSCTGE